MDKREFRILILHFLKYFFINIEWENLKIVFLTNLEYIVHIQSGSTKINTSIFQFWNENMVNRSDPSISNFNRVEHNPQILNGVEDVGISYFEDSIKFPSIMKCEIYIKDIILTRRISKVLIYLLLLLYVCSSNKMITLKW